MIKIKKSTFIFTLSALTVLMSCKDKEHINVDEYVKKIDAMSFSDSLYVFRVDSNRNVIDTLAFRKLKYDADNKLVFENNINLKSNLSTLNYYDEINGMVYSEVRVNDEIFSDFSTTIEQGLIVSANYNIYENKTKVDSVIMSYHYTFDKEKKISLLIDSGDDYRTIENYNAYEKPVLNFLISDNDTIEKTHFIYDETGKSLKKKIFKNFSRDEKIIYEYNNNEPVKESYYKNNVEESYINYYKDEKGNYLNYMVEN